MKHFLEGFPQKQPKQPSNFYPTIIVKIWMILSCIVLQNRPNVADS